MDLNDINSQAAMLDAAEAAIDGIDTVLIAHGTLSNQKACEQSVEETLAEINTNALSTISLLTHIANRFEKKRTGTIAVISSVAGDRGRASNYVYGSAKAMVTAFTSGMRQRLYKSNVAVVTIKPGLVDTPMTAEFKKGLLWAKPDQIAVRIIKAIDTKKTEVYLPAFWWLVMRVISAIPHAIFIRKKYKKLHKAFLESQDNSNDLPQSIFPTSLWQVTLGAFFACTLARTYNTLILKSRTEPNI